MARPDERVAQNDAAFRLANEEILQSARDYDVTEAIPFLCDCPDASCTAVIRLAATEYERIRAEPHRFFNAPGHAARSANPFEVVERHPTYEVVVSMRRPAEAPDEPRP
jgi:hypothetical protein